MKFHWKYLLLFLTSLFASTILALYSDTFTSRKVILYDAFACSTWKQYSYIDATKYQQCLQSRRNEAFWSVEGIRHTAFQPFLNSSSIIVEVGGNSGRDTSKFIRLYNSSIITFEPLTTMAKDLVEKFRNNPKIEVRPFGLGQRARNISVELFDAGNEGTSVFRKISSNHSSKLQHIQLLDVVQVIEKIRETRNKDRMIDMMSINCEGCEFEIIPALIVNNLLQYIRIIQFGSHPGLVRESSCIYCQIEQALARTHRIVYHYTMVWEAWILKSVSVQSKL